MNLVLIAPNFECSTSWVREVERAVPNLKVVVEGEIPDENIGAALVDGPPRGCLQRYPNLQFVLSLSAGVDELLMDPLLPAIPIVRLVNDQMAALMREYVTYQVLRLHRGFRDIERLQTENRWEWMSATKSASSVRVSVLGLGRLGLASALALQQLGFQVNGWSRTTKSVSEMRCFSGQGGLQELLPITDILVCLLPLTPATAGLMNADLFARLPRGASILNASRGGCHNEPDLLQALDSGQLSHAALDVFEVEPLPNQSRLWLHPRVTITPHMAAYPEPTSFIPQIQHAFARLTTGVDPQHLVDRSRGY